MNPTYLERYNFLYEQHLTNLILTSLALRKASKRCPLQMQSYNLLNKVASGLFNT